MGKFDDKTPDPKAVDRRGFLKAVGGVGTVAAAAVVAPIAASPAQAQGADDKRRARYQKTEHVENFYRTNRY
ncbi:twin-arginine translocation signal domain-containing protein [Salinarimonas sp.]|uniref:twin-arginine translocation signal domain-containing protein n=1 Tax=Salinarimonas sp. TaxID=2766526 RepID=UPI00391A83F6